MRVTRWLRGPGVCLALSVLALVAASSTWAAESLSHGYFKDVQIDRPRGDPRSFVIWLGSESGDPSLVKRLVDAGSMVARVDTQRFTAALEVDNGNCLAADGSIENLSRHIQAFYKLSTYLAPIIVGDGAGSPLAYVLAVQSQPDAIVGAVSLGFCPVLQTNKPMCGYGGLKMQKREPGFGFDVTPAPALRAPWVALQIATPAAPCGVSAAQPFAAATSRAALAVVPDSSLSVALNAAVASLSKHQAVIAPPPASLADLPLVEVPALPVSASATAASAAEVKSNGHRMAILLSGDGGWAEIDKGIAASLAEQGIAVAGFDSLRYFWSKRTPEGLAKDLDRMIRYYSANWNKSQVVLIGYSQGADVLPFAVNRLPAASRAKVRLTALLGLGEKASFEFHVTNWLGPSGDRPIAPEASKMSASDTLCLHGDKEPHSLCPSLPAGSVTALQLPGNHHFNGAYPLLATIISEQADKSTPPR